MNYNPLTIPQDEANNEENLEWLNSLREVRSNIPPEDVGKQYVQVAEFFEGPGLQVK